MRKALAFTCSRRPPPPRPLVSTQRTAGPNCGSARQRRDERQRTWPPRRGTAVKGRGRKAAARAAAKGRGKTTQARAVEPRREAEAEKRLHALASGAWQKKRLGAPARGR